MTGHECCRAPAAQWSWTPSCAKRDVKEPKVGNDSAVLGGNMLNGSVRPPRKLYKTSLRDLGGSVRVLKRILMILSEMVGMRLNGNHFERVWRLLVVPIISNPNLFQKDTANNKVDLVFARNHRLCTFHLLARRWMFAYWGEFGAESFARRVSHSQMKGQPGQVGKFK